MMNEKMNEKLSLVASDIKAMVGLGSGSSCADAQKITTKGVSSAADVSPAMTFWNKYINFCHPDAGSRHWGWRLMKATLMRNPMSLQVDKGMGMVNVCPCCYIVRYLLWGTLFGALMASALTQASHLLATLLGVFTGIVYAAGVVFFGSIALVIILLIVLAGISALIEVTAK